MHAVSHERTRKDKLIIVSQNVRNLTSIKLAKLAQLALEGKAYAFLLQETWIITPTGCEVQELCDGKVLLILAGLKRKVCNRGSQGVGILLSPQAVKDWKDASSKISSHSPRHITLDTRIQGTKARLATAWAPTSGAKTWERQDFFHESLDSCLGCDKNLNIIGIDSNASVGRASASPARFSEGKHRKFFRPVGHRGFGRANKAGTEFREWLTTRLMRATSTFFKQRKGHKGTWMHPHTRSMHQIDHVLTNALTFSYVTHCGIAPNFLHVESDHRAVQVVLQLRSQRQRKARILTRWDVTRLRDEDTAKLFTGQMLRATAKWETQTTTDEIAADLRQATKGAADTHIATNEKVTKQWYLESRDQLDFLLKRLVRKKQDFATGKISRRALHSAKAKLRHAEKMAKETFLLKRAKAADASYGSPNPRALWDAIAELREGLGLTKPHRTAVFKGPDGREGKTPTENAKILQDYLGNLFNHQQPCDLSILDQLEATAPAAWMDAAPTRLETRQAISSLKPNKATSNRIPAETIKCYTETDTGFENVHRLISQIWNSGSWETLRPIVEEYEFCQEAWDSMSVKEQVQQAKERHYLTKWAINRKRGASQERYDKYKDCTTIQNALEAGAWEADLLFDYRKGLLAIYPGHVLHVVGTEEINSTAPDFPEEWRQIRCVPIPKKGNLALLKNWRTLGLMDAMGTVFEAILTSRLAKNLRERAVEEQNGFAEQRGCMDGIFSLKMAFRKRKEQGLDTWAVYLDLVKAFDTVNRDVLWRCLEIYGVPAHCRQMVKLLYQDLRLFLKFDGKKIEVCYGVGVKQGGKGSPVLFSYIVQALVHLSRPRLRGALTFRTDMRENSFLAPLTGADVTNQGTEFKLALSVFADDTMNGAGTRRNLEHNINVLDELATALSLQMHRGDAHTESKTQFMMYPGRNNYNVRDLTPIQLRLGGHVTYTSEFKYLGSWISWDLKDTLDIQRRITAASKAYGALKTPVFRNRDMGLRVKKQLYETFVLPSLLYGCEAWAITEADYDKLRVWHMARARDMANVKLWQVRQYHISNQQVLQLTALKTVDEYLTTRALTWMGHLARMGLHRMPKLLMKAWVYDHPRTRGGQEMSWGRAAKKHLRKAGFTGSQREWMTLAQDRQEWRKLARTLDLSALSKSSRENLRQANNSTEIPREMGQEACQSHPRRRSSRLGNS